MSRRLAMLIGNSLYQAGNYRLLKAPEVDVKALTSLLKRADIGFFDEVEVSINESIDPLRKKIENFFQDKKPDDQLLLYFSGHGDRDSVGRLCLIGRNTEKRYLASTSITSSFIKEVMDNCKSRQQILVLDCCYADAFFQTKGEVQIGEHMAVPFSGRGRIVLTAASITQEAYEGEQEQDEVGLSIFTHYLVEGLESGKADRDSDGWISVDEWYQYAYERVTEVRADQTPGRWVEKQQGLIVIAKNPLLSRLSESSHSFVAPPDNTPESIFNEKSELTKLLLKCTSMRDIGIRNKVIEQLPEEIFNAVQRHSRNQTDVFGIIEVCLNYQRGLRRLIDIIRRFEGNSLPMQRIDEFLKHTILEY